MELETNTELTELRARVGQLQTALDTRIVVEQAKGMLAERFQMSIDDAFPLLRYAARSSRTNLHELAQLVVTSPSTPHSITVATARQQRWRAAGQRERAEAHRRTASIERERAHALSEKLRRSIDEPADPAAPAS